MYLTRLLKLTLTSEYDNGILKKIFLDLFPCWNNVYTLTLTQANVADGYVVGTDK